MSFQFVVVFISLIIAVNTQRSPYAGSRPGSGYKDRFVPTSSTDSTTGDVNNRLGEDGVTGTTRRLPYDALGDAVIVQYWNSLPPEQRPFWILNQQAIEAHRGTSPTNNAASSNNAGATTVAQSIGGNGDIINRFNPNQNGIVQAENGFGNINAQPVQEIVYPSNITPEQQVQMEIQFLQERLQFLQRRQQAQQAQKNGQQQQTQQSQQQLPLQQQPLRNRRHF